MNTERRIVPGDTLFELGRETRVAIAKALLTKAGLV